MGDTVATLGIKVTSSGVKETATELDNVSKSSDKAQKSIDKMIDSLRQQNIIAEKGKAFYSEYTLKLLGASDAELKYAKMLNLSTESHKKIAKEQREYLKTQEELNQKEIKRQGSIKQLIEDLKRQEIQAKSGKAGLAEYRLSLLGASDAEKKEAQELIKRTQALHDANSATNKHGDALKSLISRLSALGAAYFGVQAIKGFASSLIDTAKIADNYKYSLQAVSDSNEQAGETFNYLVSESKRLGTSVTGQVDAFTGFAASAKAAGMTVEETRSAYTGLNEAMTALHRSPEQAGAALNALQQMLATGTVRAQELNIQLANAIPGAVPLFAKALDKDVGELKKLMKDGLIPAKEAVILFTDYLSNNFQNKVESASNSVTANITKMNNAWFFFKKAIIDSAGSNTTNIIKDLTKEIESLTSSLSTPEGQKALKDTADGLYAIGKAALWAMDSLASFFKVLSDIRKESKQKMDVGGGNPFGQFIEGIQKAKEGELSFLDFFKASIGDRSRMLKSIDDSHKTQTENSIKYLQNQEQSWNALWVESLLSANGIMDGIKRISDAEIKRKQEAFKAKGMTIAQGEELEKLIDKIKEQAEVAGKTDIQIMEGNLRKLTSDEALIKSQLDLMKTTEAKNKAAREAESERERAAEKAIADEKARQGRVDAIINKMKEQIATYKQATEVSAEYQLVNEKASPDEIKLAKDLANTIDALKAKTKAQEAYKKIMDKTAPDPIEMNRQKSIEAVNQAVKDGAVLNDTYAKTLEQINNHFDKLEMAESDKALKEMGNELDKLTKFDGSSFGNTIADGINNAMISMNKLNDTFDNNAKAQALIIKLQKEISTGKGSPEERKEKLEQIDKAESKMIKNQISGYRQLFGTASQLFKENSREREVMHNIEMAFAAAEIAMNLEKTISAAYTAIMVQGTGDPYSAFARIAAMTALAGGIVAAAGGSLSGGGSGSAPTASASSTQGTGTVMGNPSEKSQSANNALEFMKDIEAKQYNELRDINKGVVDLNNNITNLVTNIVRTGAGTGDMGIKTGTSTSTSELQNISSKGFLAAANLMNLGTISASQAIASLTKNIPVLGNITAGVSDWINDTVSSFSSAVFGGTKKTSILAQGLEVSTAKIGDLLEGAGLDIQKFADIKIKKSGGLFGSDKTYLKTITEQLTPDEESIKIMFTNVFKNVGETMVAISKELNMGDDKLKEIYSYVFDIGKIDLKGLDSDQINEAISSVINTASDQAVTALFGELIGKYVQVGEALLETAIRVVSERAVVLDILEMTGQGFKDSDIPAYSLEVTQSLISVAGGIKELQDASATYYDKFFTDNEKQIRLQGQLAETMAYMGLSMPSTRDGLREIVESLDLTTDAGQRGYVTLLGLSESFDSVFSKIEAENEKRLELELQIMNLTGKGAEAVAIQRNKEIDALSEANKPLQQRIYDLQDESAALEAAKKEADERTAALKIEADAIKAINEKKFDLEIQILKLTGKESEALILQRQKEIDSLDEINKPLQERIYALTDEAKAIEKINTINAQRKTLEIELLNATGKTAEATAMSRQIELASMDESLRSLKLQIWAANDLAAANELVIKAEEERIQSLKDAAEISKQIAQEQLESAKTMLQDAVSARIEFLTDLENKAKENLQVVSELLQRSFEDEKNKIVSDHAILINGLTNRLDEAKTAASDLEGVFSSLSSARKSMFVSGSETEQYKSIQAQLFSALGLAQGGNLSGAKALSENIGGISGGSPTMFSTEEEYKRDFFKTYRALAELEELTDTQLTEQQQIVKNLETQIEIADVNNKLTLESLQDQYDAVLGVDKSVTSFANAVVRYQKAQYEANGANALLKTQTEILTSQMNALLGINNSIISVNDAIDRLVFAQAAVAASKIPAFAAGGYHSGGPMIVGERGPEVLNAPPAMITSNNDLKSIMSNEEVVAELKAMRTELARANFELVKNSGESKKTLREWQEIGILTRTA